MADKVKTSTREGNNTESSLEIKVGDGVHASDQPTPIQENVPAGQLAITALQAAVDARFKKNEAELEKINQFMLLGFFVLMVMVASMVVMVLLDYKNSVNKYTDAVNQLQKDQYQFQQKEINFLINMSTTSAKIKQ